MDFRVLLCSIIHFSSWSIFSPSPLIHSWRQPPRRRVPKRAHCAVGADPAPMVLVVPGVIVAFAWLSTASLYFNSRVESFLPWLGDTTVRYGLTVLLGKE